jgi:hypothetical protein
LPQYIAVRFNLKIDNVYRGLLLGTGPLIDPGWCGRLSFPLHNLTTNDYEFKAGDEVIWVEFTKISKLPNWRIGAVSPNVSPGKYRPFTKRGGSVQERLAEAAPHQAIRSSLDEAYERANRAAKLTDRIQIWGATALLIGLATLVALVVDVGTKTNGSGTTTTVTTTTVSKVAKPAVTGSHSTVSKTDVLQLQKQIDALKKRLSRIGG